MATNIWAFFLWLCGGLGGVEKWTYGHQVNLAGDNTGVGRDFETPAIPLNISIPFEIPL